MPDLLEDPSSPPRNTSSTVIPKSWHSLLAHRKRHQSWHLNPILLGRGIWLPWHWWPQSNLLRRMRSLKTNSFRRRHFFGRRREHLCVFGLVELQYIKTETFLPRLLLICSPAGQAGCPSPPQSQDTGHAGVRCVSPWLGEEPPGQHAHHWMSCTGKTGFSAIRSLSAVRLHLNFGNRGTGKRSGLLKWGIAIPLRTSGFPHLLTMKGQSDCRCPEKLPLWVESNRWLEEMWSASLH